jgi:hypothetical protein
MKVWMPLLFKVSIFKVEPCDKRDIIEFESFSKYNRP